MTTLSIAIGGFLFLDTLKDSDYSIEFVPWAGDALMHGTSILFLLLTVLNYWLSFRIFKRLQVINNRFFNWKISLKIRGLMSQNCILLRI